MRTDAGARKSLSWDPNDERFERVRRLFASGRTDKADEGRALLRELVRSGPAARRDRRRKDSNP